MDVSNLQAKYSIPGLRFEAGAGGLTKAVIETEKAKGEIYLHGAHIASYQPKASEPILWMSKSSLFEAKKPIRGGVPICFPWFGPKASDPKAPAHGIARTKEWEFLSAISNHSDSITVRFGTEIDGFTVEFAVTIAEKLKMDLKVALPKNASESRAYEAALHTYFSVSDIKNVHIEGLETSDYIDKVGGTTPCPASGEAIRFSGELDRVYQNTEATCVLRDPTMKRSIHVEKSNSRSTIVWNPWIDKSARMSDFGDEEWREMVCIESANVGENAIRLAPGQTHSMTATISVV